MFHFFYSGELKLYLDIRLVIPILLPLCFLLLTTDQHREYGLHTIRDPAKGGLPV